MKELSIDYTATKLLRIAPTPSFLVEDGASKKIFSQQVKVRKNQG